MYDFEAGAGDLSTWGAVIEFLDQFYLSYCRPLCRVNVSFVFNFDLLGLK